MPPWSDKAVAAVGPVAHRPMALADLDNLSSYWRMYRISVLQEVQFSLQGAHSH